MSKRKLGRVIGLKVKKTRPEDEIQNLALRLAEALTGYNNRTDDAAAFRQQSRSEAVKVQQLNTVLLQMRDRKENPPAQTSRMDPLNEYVEADVRAELNAAKARRQEFKKISDGYTEEARLYRIDSRRLEKRIRDARDTKE